MPHFHADADKLARDYGYGAVDELDRAGIAALLGTEAFHGGCSTATQRTCIRSTMRSGSPGRRTAAGARIFEGSRVDGARAPACGPDRGRVRARFVLVAGNGYLGGLEPAVAARVMPINNFIVATAPLGEARRGALIPRDVAAADSRFVVNYFRLSADRRLLFGGGESYGCRFPADIAGVRAAAALGVYPSSPTSRSTYAWGGTLAITLNRMPAFQRLSPTSTRRQAIPATGSRWRTGGPGDGRGGAGRRPSASTSSQLCRSHSSPAAPRCAGRCSRWR